MSEVMSQSKFRSIVEIDNGSILKNIDTELERVMLNIDDINTDEKKREITVKLEITPLKDRKQVAVKANAVSKLRPAKQTEVSLFNVREQTDNGTINVLQEITNAPVGQLNIDGDIQEAPAPIKIGIVGIEE